MIMVALSNFLIKVVNLSLQAICYSKKLTAVDSVCTSCSNSARSQVGKSAFNTVAANTHSTNNTVSNTIKRFSLQF